MYYYVNCLVAVCYRTNVGCACVVACRVGLVIGPAESHGVGSPVRD